MEVTLQQANKGLRGSLEVPGDKSISHRAIMLGALAQGVTTVKNFSDGQDCLTTLAAFKKLGVEIDFDTQAKKVVINGRGFHGLWAAKEALDMGNSGTTTRLLMGILAASSFETSLVGDPSLSKRPMARVTEPLAKMGASIKISSQQTLPALIEPSSLKGTTIRLEVASAQVKSALILAALQAKGESTIIEKLPTRNHTELMLKQFGANIETLADGLTIKVQPTKELRGQELVVPGDISSAAFFMVAAALTPNSKVKLVNVSLNPTRTGILRVLEKMNANMTIQARQSDGEPLGDIIVESSKLTAIKIGPKDVPALIDELPLVALLAAHADGISEIRGAAELRFKETDRIKTVCQELGKLGVNVKELQDGMVIEGQPQLRVTADISWDSHGDHRLGMLGAVAALRNPGRFRLKNSQALGVSYPGFLTDLASLIVGWLDD